MKHTHEKIQDEQIVALLRGKDKKGIQLLYQQHARLIFGIIYRIVKMEDVAENVLQDTLLKVWQQIETYNESKGRFLAWVCQIARNKALDMVRSKAYRQNNLLNPVEPSMETKANFSSEMPVDHIGLKEVIDQLDPKYKTLIQMIYFEGYTQAEVAKELALPLGTVKSRIRKAFQELRRLLQ